MVRAARVLGAIVTYRPDSEALPKVVAAALGEVDHLVIVDNASTLASREVVHQALGSFSGSGPSPTRRFAVIENGRNEGVAVAFNQAVAAGDPSGFDFIFLLDQDSIVRAGSVDRLVREHDALSKNYRVGALQSANREPGGRIPLDSRRRDYYARRGGYSGPSSFQGLLLLNSGALIPRAVFESVGGFDERYFVDFVDYEFSLRLARQGYAVFHVPEASVEHNFVRGPPLGSVRLYYAIRELVRLGRSYAWQFPGGVAPITWTTLNRLGSATLRSGHPFGVLRLAIGASMDGLLGVTGEATRSA
ncbi:MAG: glycosyltransferase [Thermoplasmata archaeon]|nr:glycosyltransferase [Thermoplasmata archaeon]MCI4359257.1 glycosyltransferase [Thermoplasmata archaeon]